jgi:thiamine-phosphate pyrophosphorylase
MSKILRIIDANANRAREAIRVMEEAARFVLDDADLTEALKVLRHDLAGALAALPQLEANRDTAHDVGTRISTERESTRNDVRAVAVAAGKRLSEALRAVEEYAKTLPPATRRIAGEVEALRYRGYELEKRLAGALGTGHARQWELCVLISEALCHRGDWLAVASAVVAGGASCIQLREKDLADAELLERTRRIVDMAHAAGVSVVVNDRPDVALLAGADGVHIGQDDLPCSEARKLTGTQLLIGVSTSNLEEARLAVEQGADYCGIGPMYPTTTKRKDLIVGPEYAAAFVARYPEVAHLAIGGVNAENLGPLLKAGVKGVAVSSAVCAADDPAGAVRKIMEKLGRGRSPSDVRP